MPMQMGFRWYGEGNDKIKLSDIKQIPGVTSIVWALHHKMPGEVWEESEIAEVMDQLHAYGFNGDVVESVNVHDDIKIGNGISALQAGEGDVLLGHLLLHIHPRSIGTLAPDIVVEVEAMVEDADAQVRHTDLIGIGEGKGKAGFDLGFVLHDLPVLAARVTAGTGDRGQEHAFLILVHD